MDSALASELEFHDNRAKELKRELKQRDDADDEDHDAA